MREIKIEIEVLEMLYRNIIMIKDLITRVVKIQNNEELNIILKDILLEYKKVSLAISSMLKTRNKSTKQITIAEKMVTYMSIKINLGNCSKIEDVANLIIQDINFVSEQITQNIKEYSKISKTIVNIYNRIIVINNKNIENLKGLIYSKK